MNHSRNDHPHLFWVVGLLIVLCAACSRSPIFGEQPRIARVTVLFAGRNPALGPMKVGDTISVFAQASAANGDFVVTPSAVTWTSAPAGVVQLDASAARDQRVVRGTSSGNATISAVMSGVTGQATLTIGP
jgi:hypothetical protein